MNFLDQFKAARRVSTPLIAVRTPDPAATMAAISQNTNGDPLLQWDIARGLIGLNDMGQKAAAQLNSQDAEAMQNPVAVLKAAAELPGGPPDNKAHGSILFFLNVQLFLKDPVVLQAIWNLRDVFKQNGRALVMLSPEVTFPPELAQDVILFDEPYPDREKLMAIVKDAFESVKLAEPKGEKANKIVAALRGLAAFPAEQVAYMCLSKEGMKVEEIWERKRAAIENTKGLSFLRTKETFETIGGIETVKQFGRDIFNGKAKPTCLIFEDEVEKQMAGAGGGDLSGVSTDQLGVKLQAMENYGWTGQVCVGPPGCAKSLFAKALGNTFGVPVLAMDLGAAKGSLVGQSEEQIRTMIKTIYAIAGEGAYFIATCNKLDSLPPELKRRYRMGIWYFDLPDESERDAIWKVQLAEYRLSLEDVGKKPDDANWTGADIRNCCEISWRLNRKLVESAKLVTPVSQTDPQSIERLRSMAGGRFLSASYDGLYQRDRNQSRTIRAVGGVV